jgi:hypothetical protein
MRVSAFVFAIVFFAGPFGLAGQTPQLPQPAPGQPTTPGQRTPPRGAPPRAGETEPLVGTAVLRGHVTAVDGTPLRRAQVRAFSQEGRGGGVSTTDAQGKFEIKELPAGRYTISASKAGYVTMQFGQRRAEQPSGTILDVLDKQIVEKIALALPRGGVVVGRVFDEFGEPIAGVQVSAVRSRYIGGARRMTSSGGDTSDDQGSFRIYGLAPGDYLISGTLRSQGMMMMPGPGTGSTEVEGFAPGYYPGTPNMAEAQRVSVKGGQELTGINFALPATRLLRVRGRVTAANGEPAVSMMIMATPADPADVMRTMSTFAQTRGDGTFQLVGLAPGTYTLTARSMMNPMALEAGQARITVGTDDLDNVLITISAGAVASGVVRTDDGSPLPVRAQLIRVMATPADPLPEPMMGGAPPSVNEDGTFQMTGLFNRRLIRGTFAEATAEWFLKGVYWRDQDVTDTPIEFVPGQNVDGLEIVFTKKATELTGLVRDDKGQAVIDSAIVIFPGDASRWTFQSRYLRTTRVDQDGRFRLKNLPPHDDYRVIAVRDLEEGRWSDPEFLEAVRDLAARVSLGEGQTVVQDLKVTRAP